MKSWNSSCELNYERMQLLNMFVVNVARRVLLIVSVAAVDERGWDQEAFLSGTALDAIITSAN